MTTAIRRFQEEDIPFKVKWINDKKNNKYLHYDLPLREDKTIQWYKSLEERYDRVDYTITFNNEPAGLIGLLNIDSKSKEAEYYICLGEDKYKGKGIAKAATNLLIKKASNEFGLIKVYLYTEVDNIQAQKLFEKSGFVKGVLLKDDLFYNGKSINRYIYNLDVENYILNNRRSESWT
ncbi:GNAT family N-acetyltransferase [Halobacillus faecis]|uniref:N-acetyltransferase domain-containing protein n=1 Tax=Halobacillus faecis TaxID=360184 RepID=A0A511WU08_9BACI|nr:GNAT family protein [Halobacillus faecis]GEN54626.1 hypothetical protein HFA01_28880 [Halobacillus faecis]